MSDPYLIDGHKMLWHLDRVLEWQNGDNICPIYLEVSPVSFCNHRCVFCGVDFARGKDALPLDVYERRVKEMSQSGVRSIMFAGEGEPLLHPRISEMIQCTRKAGIDVALTTNGMAPDPKIWEKTLPSLSWIKFSLDAGSSEIYSRVHGVGRGGWEQVLKNIIQVLESRKTRGLKVNVGVQFLLVRENREDLEKALKIFRKTSIDYFVIKPYSHHPQSIHPKEFILNEKELSTLKDRVCQLQRGRNPRVVFRKRAFHLYSRQESPRHCDAYPFWGYVSAGGDYYSCSVHLGDPRFREGNLLKNSFQEIIHGTKRRKNVEFARNELRVDRDCRINCRMGRINEFLDQLRRKPRHVNFI